MGPLQRANHIVTEVRASAAERALGLQPSVPLAVSRLPVITTSTFLDLAVGNAPLVANAPQLHHLDDERPEGHVSHRAHEEAMMRTPVAGEPPCVANHECVGRTLIMGGSAEPLVVFMTEHEWHEFQRTKNAANLVNRRCILCQKHKVQEEWAMLVLQHTEFGGGRAWLSDRFNLVDVPGEYRHQDCFGLDPRQALGFLGPQARFCAWMYRPEYDAQNGMTRFRQLLPQVGDTEHQPLQARFSPTSWHGQ